MMLRAFRCMCATTMLLLGLSVVVAQQTDNSDIYDGDDFPAADSAFFSAETVDPPAAETSADPIVTTEEIADSAIDDAPPDMLDQMPAEGDGEIAVLLPMPGAEQEQKAPLPVARPTTARFNSKRILLVEALQSPPQTVTIGQNVVSLRNPELVASFYQLEQYPMIWSHEDHLGDLVLQLQQAVNAAGEDALNPASYHQALLAGLQPGQQQDIVALELLLTDAWLGLADSLANGIVDARRIDKTWNAPKVEAQQLSAWLMEGVIRQDVLTPIRAINADDLRYQALKRHYAAAQQEAVAINMERIRWMPQNWHQERHIFVNIPAYEVTVVEHNQNIYKTRSIVGSPDRATPRFIDRMRHVVLSPTWTVPPTIMRKDKLPQLRANPGAFDGAYEAIVGGRAVPPSSVNWHTPGAANYTLRQKPGRSNALGRVKFLFPNQHAIYLHDTPSKGLFNQSNRAKSSGCIRLQDPMDFANLLLRGTSWTPERINAGASKSKEQWVNTPQQTPIYLIYWTTWAETDGQIRQVKDVYNLDAKLTGAYKQALTAK